MSCYVMPWAWFLGMASITAVTALPWLDRWGHCVAMSLTTGIAVMPWVCTAGFTSLQDMGGVRYILLTHRDDVSDHAHWAQALGCTRIMHKLEVSQSQGTTCVR